MVNVDVGLYGGECSLGDRSPSPGLNGLVCLIPGSGIAGATSLLRRRLLSQSMTTVSSTTNENTVGITMAMIVPSLSPLFVEPSIVVGVADGAAFTVEDEDAVVVSDVILVMKLC